MKDNVKTTLVLIAVLTWMTIAIACSGTPDPEEASKNDPVRVVQEVFPMVVREVSNVCMLNAYQYEGDLDLRDSIKTERDVWFDSCLEMRVRFFLRLNCWIDLSGFGIQDVRQISENGCNTVIEVTLPYPVLSPVEFIETHEYDIREYNVDRTEDWVAQLRTRLRQRARDEFQARAISDNVLGLACQNAEDRIRSIVEGVLAEEGFYPTVIVRFSDQTNPSESHSGGVRH